MMFYTNSFDVLIILNTCHNHKYKVIAKEDQNYVDYLRKSKNYLTFLILSISNETSRGVFML